MASDDRDATCAKCAKERGYVMKNKVVGVWVGKCEFCGETRALTSLHHDWRKGADYGK